MAMKLMIAPLAAVIFAVIGLPAVAMNMTLEGDRLYMSKGIGIDDYIKYKEMVKGKEIRTVVLSNSPGGNIKAAIAIADDMIERNVTTVVAGRCLSSCTILFLAGKERQFASRYPVSMSTLGFHSTYDMPSGGYQNPLLWADVYSYYKRRLGDSLDDSVIYRAMRDISNNSGFAYLYHPTFRMDGSFCEGIVGKECEKLVGKNALSQGVITQAALSNVEIPADLLPKNDLFGVNLENFNTLSSTEGKQLLCAELLVNCSSYLERFESRSPERAIAISPGNKKTSSSWDYADKRSAVRRVMYECVSRSDSFCYLYVIGDRVTTSLYTIAGDRSTKAIEVLAERDPTQALDDPVGSYELPMRGLRIGSYDAPTPEKIDEVKEINTKEVVKMLVGKNNVAFVDLVCGDSTIPTARCIFGGGLASNEAAVDSGIEKHLMSILQAISPDKLTPIAFFCASSQCWLSANAAYRAVKAGYKVFWYRGGLRAWESKGLPLVPTTPIGAVMPNAG
jgi:rhodanese-related sulfurtransferase